MYPNTYQNMWEQKAVYGGTYVKQWTACMQKCDICLWDWCAYHCSIQSLCVVVGSTSVVGKVTSSNHNRICTLSLRTEKTWPSFNKLSQEHCCSSWGGKRLHSWWQICSAVPSKMGCFFETGASQIGKKSSYNAIKEIVVPSLNKQAVMTL